jgi:hypothetical protein
MGVRGLETYMEKYCPDACYEVYINDLIDTFRLVVDTSDGENVQKWTMTCRTILLPTRHFDMNRRMLM